MHLPSRKEPPCAPMFTKDNANADLGAGIREGANVGDGNWPRDVMIKDGTQENSAPPFEVGLHRGGGMAWLVRTVTVVAEHGLQSGEVRASLWDDQCHME